MKVFISGPMSGKPNFNREAFFKAQEELEKLGYSVWNPAWLAYPSDTEFSEDDMHDIDIEALKHCDVIYMLKGWQYSKGALAEYEIAKKRGLLTMYEDPSYFGTLYKHSRVAKPINDCYSIYDYIGSLEDEVEAIKESIGTDNLKKQLEKDFDDVYEEFQDTKDKVNDINMGYIKWSSEVSQFDERIEKLEENMKEIATNGGLGLSFNLMNERVSSNKRDISSLRNDIEKVKDTVKGLNSIVATLGERNEVLSDKFESDIEENRHYRLSVTEQLGTIRSRLKAIDNLENTNEVHWINIQGLDKKLDELIHNVAEFKDVNEAHWIEIKKLNADNKVVNNTLSTIDTCLDDLNNRLKAIEKRLSIKPFYAPTEDEKDDD